MIAVKRSKRSDPCEGIETNVVREIYARGGCPAIHHCSDSEGRDHRHDIVMRAADRDLHVSIEGGLVECAYKTCTHIARGIAHARARHHAGPQAQERPCARRSCDHRDFGTMRCIKTSQRTATRAWDHVLSLAGGLFRRRRLQ